MPLKYVSSKIFAGRFGISSIDTIGRANLRSMVRVGDAEDVPLGTKDPELLRWAEDADRILVSEDRRSMSKHLEDHLITGRHSPGVMILKKTAKLREVLEFIVLAAHATDPAEWADQLRFVP